MKTLRQGDTGDDVRAAQSRLVALGYGLDENELEAGELGPSTEAAIRTFQQERGLLVDAIVGPATWQELAEAAYAPGDRVVSFKVPPPRGDDIRTLQERLDLLGFDPGRADGILGERTDRAIRDFQRNVGLEADGVVGPTTIEALDRLRPQGPGPGRTTVRESESLLAPGSLVGRTIALDPGHGPMDAGGEGPGGLSEQEATFALAALVGAELEAAGARAELLRHAGEDPPPQVRVERAKASGADALVSIHLNTHDDPSAEGASSYYFGRLGAHSPQGLALAELVQAEITSRLGLRDGRTHPKSFPLLRETPMPAVHVEPCFLSNPKEESLLRKERFRREVARAIVAGLARFFAGPSR